MKRILLLLAISVFSFQLSCLASVNITTLTGEIKIFPAGGGSAILVKAGEPIPAITDGSKIEIESGSIKLSATSIIDLLTRGNTLTMFDGTTLEVTLNTNGAVKVHDIKGKANVKTSNGKIITMKPGTTIIIAGNNITEAEGFTPAPNDFGAGPDTRIRIEEGTPDISPDGR
jgi:hypothetical protein